MDVKRGEGKEGGTEGPLASLSVFLALSLALFSSFSLSVSLFPSLFVYSF